MLVYQVNKVLMILKKVIVMIVKHKKPLKKQSKVGFKQILFIVKQIKEVIMTFKTNQFHIYRIILSTRLE